MKWCGNPFVYTFRDFSIPQSVRECKKVFVEFPIFLKKTKFKHLFRKTGVRRICGLRDFLIYPIQSVLNFLIMDIFELKQYLNPSKSEQLCI